MSVRVSLSNGGGFTTANIGADLLALYIRADVLDLKTFEDPAGNRYDRAVVLPIPDVNGNIHFVRLSSIVDAVDLLDLPESYARTP